MEEKGNIVVDTKEKKITLTQDELADLLETLSEPGKWNGRENLTLPDPAVEKFYQDEANRVLWLQEEIKEDSIGIADAIVRFNFEDRGIPVNERQPIWLFIDSPGGLLDITLAICNVILTHKTPIIAVNMGQACSGAALIYACCQQRAAYPYASFLLHQGSGGTYGTFQQTKYQQADYEYKIHMMKQIFIDALKPKNIELFERLFDGEWYLYASEKRLGNEHNAREFNLINCEISDLID